MPPEAASTTGFGIKDRLDTEGVRAQQKADRKLSELREYMAETRYPNAGAIMQMVCEWEAAKAVADALVSRGL